MGKEYKGHTEKKSNQQAQTRHREDEPDKVDESRFEGKDQDKVEAGAGKQGRTSGESFDKYPEEKRRDSA